MVKDWIKCTTIIWQFLFTKSTELIRRVSFTKQPSLINNKPVHLVFYRDIHTYARPHHIDDRYPRTDQSQADGPVSSRARPNPDQSQAGQSQAEQSNAYFLSFRPKWKQFYRYITGNILIGVIWTGMLVELDTLTEHERH